MKPTPETLKALAEWFDSPANPAVVVVLDGKRYTGGYLLRYVADALKRADPTLFEAKP